MEKVDFSQVQKTPMPLMLKESILVIDDSSDMLMLQRTVLQIEGFEVFTAQSGAEAFEILSEIGKPDLILLDMQMQEMDGPDFLTMLEEKRPDIIEKVPVVFLTGMDQVPKSKALGFIRKGQDMDEFLEAIHRFIEMGKHSPYKRV